MILKENKNIIISETKFPGFLNFFKKIYQYIFNSNNISRIFFIYYVFAILIGTVFLFLPFSLTSYIRTNGEPFTLIDSLFTATSAFSDTGLVVTNTFQQFTIFGQLIILSLIILGGIGIMSIKILFFILIGKKIGLKERILIQSERGSSKLGGSFDLIKTAFLVIFSGIILGTLLLTPYFYSVKQDFSEVILYHDFWKSLYHAFFHSVSAINNAGFDITGSLSFIPFKNDLYIQAIIIILIIIGGIGFPVFYDIRRFIEARKNDETTHFKWSLFTKLTVAAYFIIFAFGLILTLIFELSSSNPVSLWNSANAGKSLGAFQGTPINYSVQEVINGIIFNVFSTRNAGFSTIPVMHFQEPTKVLWSFLMWIGSSPASTAGGVRTTTIAIIVLTTVAILKGRQRVFVFKNQISAKIVRRAFVVFFISCLIILTGTMVLIYDFSSSQHNWLVSSSSYTAFFEVASAFGTTGLSGGATSYINIYSKFALIIIMIIGQLGISSAISIIAPGKIKEDKIIYAKEDVVIG